MANKIYVGLLGLGTIGTGVARIIGGHQNKINQVVGQEVVIKTVLDRDIEKCKTFFGESVHCTDNFDEILNDEEISIIVELIGYVPVAKDYISKALAAGKHVVSANKDLVALHGKELVTLAKANKCDFLYEAAVAGGVPILRAITESFASDNIQKVMGIVNGTTNFMMTKMDKEGYSYDEALALAQELGFAEKNPTSDVDGLDAARKMVILARLAFGTNDVTLDDVAVTGIRNVSINDIKLANRLGYKIKLIGTAEKIDDSVNVEVGPVFVPESHPLASVNNEMNAVFVAGEALGETMFYGAGAGELPTATAVVSDVMNIAKNILMGTTGNIFNEYEVETLIAKPEQVINPVFMRLEVTDRAGQFLELAKIFATAEVSFDKIIQEPLANGKAIIVIVTHPMSKAQENEIIQAMEDNDDMKLKVHFKVLEH
ncbi:homoserine dehydrogenase [Trichococcus alkaliphilus]|uniref:homoserine dehydrogenase n=1 Tax=Trichococcus alkaliphilus TaxID=2052943 RepID=UPI000D0AF84D|nr:homoserine dehydrogenase [Trichococcus alkaliphilus]